MLAITRYIVRYLLSCGNSVCGGGERQKCGQKVGEMRNLRLPFSADKGRQGQAKANLRKGGALIPMRRQLRVEGA